MNIRTTRSTITFRSPFYLKDVDRLLPPGDIFVPAPSGSAVEMVTIDPLDLQAAQELDAKMPNAGPATARKF